MHPAAVSETPERRRFSIRKLGPRGLEGLFGWTFFDPANLVSITLLTASAALVVVSMRGRGAPDWYMPLGLYACLAVFLRGYFFNYYNDRRAARSITLLVLIGALVLSAALWEDRSGAHEVVRPTGVRQVPAAGGFHVAALLHLATAIALFFHFLMPRGWLVKATDELAERAGAEDDDPARPHRDAGEDQGPASG